jgi:predicted SAM-dependent methyltransferase
MEKEIKKLNLGCGKDYRKGWVNTDSNKNIKADSYFDMEKKFPFKDNSFDYIFTCHSLEHLHNLIGCMKEIKRVSKNGAIIDIRVPHALSIAAYQDPTYVRFFTYKTFDYFGEDGDEHYENTFPKFKIISKRLSYTAEYKILNAIVNPFINLFPVLYERVLGWILPCGELRVRLKVTK